MLEIVYRKFSSAICAMLFIIFLWLVYLIYLQITKQNYGQAEYEIISKPRANIRYLDGIDIVYWINLDRSTDRHALMTTLFQDGEFQGMPIERISAVDGKNSDLVYPRLQIMYKQKNDYEYACMLSHLDTIRKFSRTNLPVALIMEDDVTLEFKKYWRKSVREIMTKAPPDWEIIQLCYNTQGNINQFSLYERNLYNKTVCAAAYLIKNSAAKRLIGEIFENEKYNLESYIIHHADCYIFNKCITYTYKYPLFIYRTNNDSLLHPQDLKDHERSKKQIENMYSNFIS